VGNKNSSYSFVDGLGMRHSVSGNSSAIHALAVVFSRRDILENIYDEWLHLITIVASKNLVKLEEPK